jgi:hypothetical protein
MLTLNRTFEADFIQPFMRVIATILLFWLVICQAVFGQTTLYYQNFDGVSVPALPAGWTKNTPQIETLNNTPSDYSGASGAINLLIKNCTPLGEFRTFQVSGISSVNAVGITVGFGHRRTNAFDVPVSLEWSSNGTSWNSISYDTPATPSVWEFFTSSILPPSAENQTNLRFRWSYTTDDNNNCITATPNLRIDDFTVTAQTILPVELLSFTVTPRGNAALLAWSTASERNNDYFSIEHSADGLHYREIGQVQGAGDSDDRLDYSYTHDYPVKGLNYYRLRQVDFDGAYEYSPVRSLRFSDAKGLDSAVLYPSPVATALTVRLSEVEESATHWQILDTSLRTVAKGYWAAGQPPTDIAVDGFAAGWYVLQLIREKETAALRFVKQ